MRVSAVVLAAGKGARFKSKASKLEVKINSKPLVIRSLVTLSRHRFIREIVVVVNAANKKNIERIVKRFRLTKVKKIVLGGRLRQDSSYNGLLAVTKESDFVLIHDAARPFVTERIVTRCLREAKKSGAAVAAVPMNATIKRVSEDYSVKQTIDRKGLWEIQTPQAFRKSLIQKAYRRRRDTEVTDDAALVERLKYKVKIVKGSCYNIKITTLEDLKLARALVNLRK